jgi:hypothetical protein
MYRNTTCWRARLHSECFSRIRTASLALILAATTLYFDRQRVRIGTVALPAVPYLVIGAGWALYIAQSPADFLAQS